MAATSVVVGATVVVTTVSPPFLSDSSLRRPPGPSFGWAPRAAGVVVAASVDMDMDMGAAVVVTGSGQGHST